MSSGAERLARVDGVSPDVRAMMAAVPDFSVGDALHDAFRWVIEDATPGSWLVFPQPIERSYADTFFPGRRRDGFVSELKGLVPFQDWTAMATALCASAMATLVASAHINKALADQDVATYNAQAFTGLTQAYARLFTEQWTDFAVPYARVNRPEAKEQYQAALLQSVPIRELWYAEGAWKHPEWELYHHWIKLLALGASVSEVTALIAQLAAANLTIADSVSAANWTTFAGFLQNAPILTVDEIQNDGRSGLTDVELTPLPSSPGMTVGAPDQQPMIPVQHAVAFIDTDPDAPGPGARYYQAPQPTSCFSGDTPVWLADGFVCPIESVEPGTVVATPDGPQRVALVASVLRRGRKLVRFDGHDFGFTETHPFLSGAHGKSGARLVARDPLLLAEHVPILSRHGVDPLAAGAALVTQSGPRACPPIVEIDDVCDEAQLLYDLILVPSATKRSAFFVGSEEAHSFAAVSEIPPFEPAHGATVALLEALVAILPTLMEAAVGKSEAEVARMLERLGVRAEGVALGWALATLDATHETDELELDDIHAHVADHLALFSEADGAFHRLASNSFDVLSRALGDELDGFTQLGFRARGMPGSERLALTLFGSHLRRGVSGGGLYPVVTWHEHSGRQSRHESVPSTCLQGRRATTSHATFHDEVFVAPHAATEGCHFTVELFHAATDALAGIAVYPSVAPRRLGYRYLELPIRDSGAGVIGHLQCDLRTLSHSAVQAEAARRRAYSRPKMLGDARRLGRTLGVCVQPFVQSCAAGARPNRHLANAEPAFRSC